MRDKLPGAPGRPGPTNGPKPLAAGKDVALRLWERWPPSPPSEPTCYDREMVGFVIDGAAIVHIEGRSQHLQPGSSWVVPKDTLHCYEILEPFTAVAATAAAANRAPATLARRAADGRAAAK